MLIEFLNALNSINQSGNKNGLEVPKVLKLNKVSKKQKSTIK